MGTHMAHKMPIIVSEVIKLFTKSIIKRAQRKFISLICHRAK